MSEDAFEDLIGDGDAKIAVSMNMKDSSYGTGFGAHVTVTLTCNQDENTIRDARAMAGSLAQEFLDQSFKEAHEIMVARNEDKRREHEEQKEKTRPPSRTRRSSRKARR